MISLSTLHAVNVVIGILAICCLLYGPYQTLITDLVRQRLFEIRDRIFDIAAKGELAFDAEAYTLSREWLNRILRYAHALTWPRILFMNWVVRDKIPAPYVPAFVIAIQNIKDESVKKEITHQIQRSFYVIAALIWLRSPLLMIATIFLPLLAIAIFINDSIRRALRKLWEMFKEEVLRETVVHV